MAIYGPAGSRRPPTMRQLERRAAAADLEAAQAEARRQYNIASSALLVIQSQALSLIDTAKEFGGRNIPAELIVAECRKWGEVSECRVPGVWS